MKKIFVSFLFCYQAIAAQDVYIIGSDQQGKEHVHSLTSGKVKELLNQSQIEHFNAAKDVLTTNRNASSWELTSFSIGLGIEGEIGLGPWDLGLAIKQRLIFKRD